MISTDPALGIHAYTHPTVLSAAIDALRAYRADLRVHVLPDPNAFGLSSKFLYDESGYSVLAKESHFTLLQPETQILNRYVLAKDRSVRERIVEAPVLIAESPFRVYCPKIRADHFCSDFAGAVRLGREFPATLEDEESATDMLEICSPELVIGDAIVVPVGGARSSQRGQELGAVLVANNAVAHDVVAAMMLNLDPAHIPHLLAAAARKWGPASVSQIDLGGGGEQALRLLSQKTRSWRIGGAHLARFKERYEYDHPGLKFPIEIQSTGRESGVLLDSLLLAADIPATRIQMSRWPQCSIVTDPIRTYPSHTLVFTFGAAALHSVMKLCGEITKLASIAGMTLSRAVMKNSKVHWIVSLDDRRTRQYWAVAVALWIGSLGRIRIPILTGKLIVGALSAKFKRAFKHRRLSTRLGITSSLRQNTWWTKMPTLRKETDVSHDHDSRA